MSNTFRKGQRVSLRPLEPSDAERCLCWINDEETSRFLVVGRFPLNLVREEEWLRGLYGSNRDVPLAICLVETGEHIGTCGLHEIELVDRCATLGIVIGVKEQRGRGLGEEACVLLLQYAFATLNMNRIELTVFEFNEQALRCYRKLGFVEEGRRRQRRFVAGRYWDQLDLAILRTEWQAGRAAGGNEQ